MRSPSSATQPRTPKDWTADECAEDLLAQLEELLEIGATSGQLQDALEREGLQPQTAAQLLSHLQTRSVSAQPLEQQPLDPDAPCGIDTLAFRHWIRAQKAIGPLQEALQAQGCPSALAAQVVSDLAEAEQAFATHQRARMRSLGGQAMLAGSLFTFALLVLASGPGPRAWWNVLPATGTAALVLYGAVLRRRHTEPQP